jgi:hypothetical protein
LCVGRWRSLRRADHSSRGVLPKVVCFECDRESSIIDLDPMEALEL